MNDHAIILLAALILDWYVGDPEFLWRKIPHPVAWMGWAIGILERRFNHGITRPGASRRNGAVAISILVLLAIFAGLFIRNLLAWSGGWLIEIVIVSIFLAQKSLRDHAVDVANAFDKSGVALAREKVAYMVGRDPQYLDQSGICRATIESVAENFSDGVVAPAFWYLIFGLPGLFAYKMINTADSMVGYRSEKFRDYGRASAKLDDLANWLPARMSVGFILFGAIFAGLGARVIAALKTVMRDAGLHASPNAGWPEAAMAGVCNIALGGPRNYGDRHVLQSYINSGARIELNAADIHIVLRVYSVACISTWAFIGVVALLF